MNGEQISSDLLLEHLDEVQRVFGSARSTAAATVVALLDTASSTGGTLARRLGLQQATGVIVRALAREAARAAVRAEIDLFEALAAPSAKDTFQVLVASHGGVGVLEEHVGPAIWTRVQNVDCIEDMIAMGLALQTLDDSTIQEMIAASPPPQDAVRQKYALAELWLRNGLARVSLGHKHAAALMATSTPPEVLADARMPWPVFAVAVPSGLLALPGGGDLVNAFFWREDEVVMCSAGDARDLTFSFGGPVVHDSGIWDGDGSHVAELLMRLWTGVVLELNEYRPSPNARQNGQGAKRRSGEDPSVETVVLKRDVKVDVRAAVHAYSVGGTATAPTVQRLVRGHWKNQVHGPGRALRKRIFVEPYWQGPDDAPLGARMLLL